MIRRLLLAGLVLSLGCERSAPSHPSSETTMVGDTALVRIEAPQQIPLSVTIDSVEVIWAPADLRAIRFTAVGEQLLLASDGRTVLGFRRADGVPFPIGVVGEGPGEYRRVASIAIGPEDGITVVDPVQARVLRFDATGRALPDAGRPLAASPSWSVRSVASDALAGGTFDLAAWDHGLISVDGLEDTMRVAMLVRPDSAETLFRVPEGLWATIDGVPAKREAYGVRAVVALDRQDGAAVSTGVDYVIRWWRPAATPRMLRIERTWPRATAGGELDPPPALLAGLGPTGEMLTKVAAGQARGDLKNAVEQLVLPGQGRLLVKVVDSTAQYHPYFLGRMPELRPPHWTWELFDTAGELRGQLLLPSAFAPSRVDGCWLWGVLEQSDGTQAVSRVDLGEACGWFDD